MDDVTNFPEQDVVDLAESRPYEEGRYRPPSMPAYAGIFPTHMFLSRGKSYDWCSCGHSQINPMCDGQCKWILTRCRPVTFNVSEAGYFKLCNCKLYNLYRLYKLYKLLKLYELYKLYNLYNFYELCKLYKLYNLYKP